MKTKTMIKRLGVALVYLFLMMMTVTGYSQLVAGSQVTLSMQNVVYTSNTVEYDLYLKNTSTAAISSLKLAAYNGNVRFSPALLPSGATMTMTMVTQPSATGNFPTLANLVPAYLAATQQCKWTETIQSLASGNCVSMPSNVDMKFARFRLTSSLPFVEGTAVSYFFQTTSTGGYQVNTATTYGNANISSGAQTLAAGGTPPYLILGGPYSIPVPVSTICATTGSVSNATTVTCFGGNNGSATVTMSPVPTLSAVTYTVDGGASTAATLAAGLTAGVHSVVVSNAGCANVTVPVTISGPASALTTSTTATACDTYTWSVSGLTYTTSGAYTFNTVNGSGCTVENTLTLTINNSTTTSLTATACDTYTWAANGLTYATSGVYTNTTTNAAGCPNVATLNLTINNSTTTSLTATACDTYTWAANGMTYTTSGVYTNTTTNAAGCPNVETLTLTINNSTTTSSSATACDTYTWAANGTTYTTSGVYTATTTNAAGCPNVETLTLTINVSTTTYYADADGDGYGNAASSVLACTQPLGYVLNNTDCNDSNPAAYQTGLLFVDADGDHYTVGASTSVCYGATVPAGYSATSLGADCDDTNGSINSGMVEILYNGIDDNCNGALDEGHQIVTQVLATQCGTTIATMSSSIGCNSILGATGYRFRVKNTLTNVVQIIDRPSNWFQLNQLATYDYGTPYLIDVMVQKAGVWLGYYGTSCTVSSPAISLPGSGASVIASQCGVTLPFISSIIYTNILSGVTGYRFKVTNTATSAVQIIDRTPHWFSMKMLPSYTYGVTYLVEVAVKTTGAYSAYGSPCSVTTPAPTTLNATSCGATIATKSTVVYATSQDMVTSWRFQITNTVTNVSQVIDRPLAWFQFNMITYSPSTVYDVRIAVQSTGTFSAFGEACQVTSPATTKAAITTTFSDEFRVVAVPNPFTNSFGLDLKSFNESNVEVKIYDMIGKLLEVRDVQFADVQTQSMGDKYPSGVYNVIVTQGDNVKTLRVIKR
jgi:hypothetical protein